MLRAFAVCCLFMAAAPQTASAEWHIVPMIGLTFKGETSVLDLEGGSERVHRNFGAAVSLLGDGILGAEVLGILTPAFFQGNTSPDLDLVERGRTYALMANVVLTTPRRLTEFSLRPYVSGGVGLLRISVEDASNVLPVDANLTGLNIGGGAVGFLSRHTGLRFDLRYFSSLHRSEAVAESFGRTHLSYMTASVGIVIRR